ncbi:MAG: hypothetical protein AAGB22_03995, partial [Bacteroidota bacterium]
AYPLEAAGGAPERTLIFESAGLGGNHPHASGRSIAHTEKQVRAMRRNALDREESGQPPFEIRSQNHTFNLLDQPPKDYMISTNSACTQGSNCAAIPEREVFSRRSGNTMYYMNPYDQGAANNDHVLRDMLRENTNLDAPGQTFFISQDNVRGRDFDTISHLSAETVSDVDADDIWDEQLQRFDNS